MPVFEAMRYGIPVVAWACTALEKTGNPASASKGCWRMRNAKLGGRSTYGALTAVSDRRTRRAERQFLVNNIAVAGAFLFVGAVVFGLVG